jgi:hypothetical protein
MDIGGLLKSLFDISDELAEQTVRLFEHLPAAKDHQELMVLKGHLLIEEVLNELVEKAVIKQSALRKAKLTFSQVLRLAESIYYRDQASWVWPAADKLNRIRNKMAHSLAGPEVSIMISEFVEACIQGQRKEKYDAMDLRMALSCLYIGVAKNMGAKVVLNIKI